MSFLSSLLIFLSRTSSSSYYSSSSSLASTCLIRPLIIALGFFHKFTRKRVIIINKIIIITRKSIFITSDILGRGRGIVFYLLLPSFAIRHVCFESLGKSDLLDEVLSFIAMVATSSLFDSELSSFRVLFLANMSLAIRLLLSIFLIFLVAFVKLLSLIWVLDNEVPILAIIVAHPL
jgi:hypothetical protein